MNIIFATFHELPINIFHDGLYSFFFITLWHLTYFHVEIYAHYRRPGCPSTEVPGTIHIGIHYIRGVAGKRTWTVPIRRYKGTCRVWFYNFFQGGRPHQRQTMPEQDRYFCIRRISDLHLLCVGRIRRGKQH